MGAKLAMLLGLHPRHRLEKQLTALLIPHSWIRERVSIIILKEIEIRRGKEKGRVKEGRV